MPGYEVLKDGHTSVRLPKEECTATAAAMSTWKRTAATGIKTKKVNLFPSPYLGHVSLRALWFTRSMVYKKHREIQCSYVSKQIPKNQ